MKICITGIAGFIGFHLALKLKKLGWEPKVSIEEGVTRFAGWYIEQFH